MEKLNQELIERIKRIKVPEDLLRNKIGIIPLGKSVLASRVKGGERKVGGLILPDAASTQEYIARIVAVGPEVSEYLRVGLLVIYNSMANMESIIKGERYLCMHESSVYYILEDEDTRLYEPPISSEEKRKTNKVKEQDRMLKRVENKNNNDEDVFTEKIKNKNRKIFAVSKS